MKETEKKPVVASKVVCVAGGKMTQEENEIFASSHFAKGDGWARPNNGLI